MQRSVEVKGGSGGLCGDVGSLRKQMQFKIFFWRGVGLEMR